MEKRIELARQGRQVWLNLVEQYNIDNRTFVIVLPDTCQEYHKVALEYLPAFLNKRHGKRGMVLTYCEEVMKYPNAHTDVIQTICIREEDIHALVQFYCLYEFSPNIIIASLQQPAGRMGMGIVDEKGLSLKEVFAGVVYGILEEESNWNK